MKSINKIDKKKIVTIELISIAILTLRVLIAFYLKHKKIKFRIF